MKLGDLLITRGLSSLESDLRGKRMGIFESIQGMENGIVESRMDGFCVFKP